MGYLFLLIALLAGVTKGYCGKKTSGYTNSLRDATLANIIRMMLCILIGFLLIIITGDLKKLIPSRDMLLISLLCGASTAVFVVTWLISVKKGAYMMLDIFLMLGVLIPLIASNFFFNEVIKPSQWIGIVILLVAVGIMCSYNNSIKAKITPFSLVLLIICGIANGIADFSQKLFAKCILDGSAAVFNFYTYVFAALILIVSVFVTGKTELTGGELNIKKFFSYILIMAFCLFANSYFKTLASGYLNAVLLYPLNQGCSLILSAIMSAVLFKEKITIKAVIGIFTAFIGLLIINLL